MKDERRECSNCNHTHAWGVLRYSMDNTPLWGARKCWCLCDRFVAKVEGNENLPALTNDQTQALWAKTSFLSAQVPAATRIAMAGIANLLEVASTELPSPSIVAAVREFMGLVISQITDLRGAMVRDESKFAHLVAHTDEIVESMRGVVQLNERLMTIGMSTNEMAERMAGVEQNIASIAEILNALVPKKVEVAPPAYDKLTDWNDIPAKDLEARRVFLEKTADLQNEAIVTDADHLDG